MKVILLLSLFFPHPNIIHQLNDGSIVIEKFDPYRLSIIIPKDNGESEESYIKKIPQRSLKDFPKNLPN